MFTPNQLHLSTTVMCMCLLSPVIVIVCVLKYLIFNRRTMYVTVGERLMWTLFKVFFSVFYNNIIKATNILNNLPSQHKIF